ncbi:DUF2470 domain-containing protein [Labedaea rhizosphaerae]|uniref:Uncharacterized protein DUF2470 n=1 Tax=Labedaea rhizosphaerae TaxID=598644 RepID=A0A4V3D0B1_LABRH|nr:DUF2470 domain-containing protein [Labedaea rhizosphaerae]TDQ05065.1 uncharacterized protein DUF2470 [Labedaea rhizosphaerae]
MGRPPAPHPAERARTIAALGGRANLVPAADRVTPIVHQLHGDGSAAVVLPDDHPLVAQARSGEVSAVLELADLAPVPLREPVRGLLWVTGWLRALSGAEARAEAVRISESRPDPRLLDVGHDTTVLVLRPASMVLADGAGTTSVSLEQFAAADPDPFCHYEAEWLRHLELRHADVVGSLSRHVPDDLRGGHIRPLGLDRLGLRLRVEAVNADHDVRMAFSRPIATPQELSGELRRLVGCPFLAARRVG